MSLYRSTPGGAMADSVRAAAGAAHKSKPLPYGLCASTANAAAAAKVQHLLVAAQRVFHCRRSETRHKLVWRNGCDGATTTPRRRFSCHEAASGARPPNTRGSARGGGRPR